MPHGDSSPPTRSESSSVCPSLPAPARRRAGCAVPTRAQSRQTKNYRFYVGCSAQVRRMITKVKLRTSRLVFRRFFQAATAPQFPSTIHRGHRGSNVNRHHRREQRNVASDIHRKRNVNRASESRSDLHRREQRNVNRASERHPSEGARTVRDVNYARPTPPAPVITISDLAT